MSVVMLTMALVIVVVCWMHLSKFMDAVALTPH